MQDAELLAIQRGSHAEWYREMCAGTEGARCEEVAPGVVAAVMPGVPERSLFNGVVYRDTAALVGSLEALAELYDEAGVLAWTVWVTPGDAEALAALEAAGHQFDGRPESMAAPLTEIALDGPGAGVVDAGSWEEICALNDAAYGLEAVTFLRALPARPPGWRTYVARDEEGPLAGVVPFVDGTNCHIAFVATHPRGQRRGLATALMRAALRDAREAGCTTTSLDSSAAGRPVYKRLGYRPLGELQMWERRRSA